MTYARDSGARSSVTYQSVWTYDAQGHMLTFTESATISADAGRLIRAACEGCDNAGRLLNAGECAP